MESVVEFLFIILLLLDFHLLSTSRIMAAIRAIALQAVVLGVLPLFAGEAHGAWVMPSVIATTTVKAGILPWLMRRATREAGVHREIEPLVGFSMSLVIGLGLLGASFLIARPLYGETFVQTSNLFIPVALFTVMTGLFLIVARKKAITQAIGYLAMENGIFAFGMVMAVQEPVLVEMGVLLDVFAAVFVMGITICHISREFDHIDIDRLSTLKD